MRRNLCDIYIYVYLVNPIIFFINSELNQMCDVRLIHMLRHFLTQMKCAYIVRLWEVFPHLQNCC